MANSIRLITDDLSWFYKLKPADKDVLFACLKYLEGDEIVLTADRRYEIASNVGISINTVNCSISNLKKADIIVMRGRKYILNNTYIKK